MQGIIFSSRIIICGSVCRGPLIALDNLISHSNESQIIEIDVRPSRHLWRCFLNLIQSSTGLLETAGSTK